MGLVSYIKVESLNIDEKYINEQLYISLIPKT